MNLLSIASGSKGNCTYIGTQDTHILIDIGISTKKVLEGLQRAGREGSDISAIFITHEHVDHIQGLGVFLRKYKVPVYGSKGTIEGILLSKGLGEVDTTLFKEIEDTKGTKVGDMDISSFSISHDAREPLGFIVEGEGRKVGFCTDLGVYDEDITLKLQGMNGILIEANHDVKMLQVGPYPYNLKQRVLSKQGHLSNENAGKLLTKILHHDLKWIILGHLSQENNLPELAYEAVRMEITLGNNPYMAEDFNICVCTASGHPNIIEI